MKDAAKISNLESVQVEKFEEREYGLSGDVGIKAIYNVPNLENQTKNEDLIGKGYLPLSTNKFGFDGIFNGSISKIDIGLFFVNRTFDNQVNEVIVLNFSKNKILFYRF